MILRIKTSDFSQFCGYEHGTNDSNRELNKYINIFNTNEDFKYFQIESKSNDLTIEQIAYIEDKVIAKRMFIKTDFSDDGKNNLYTLCFCKK